MQALKRSVRRAVGYRHTTSSIGAAEVSSTSRWTDAQTFGGEKRPNVKTAGFRGSNFLIKWQRSTWGLISKTFSNNHIGRLRRSREPPKTVSIEFGYVSTRVRYITPFGLRKHDAMRLDFMRVSGGIAVVMVSLLVSGAAETNLPPQWEWASPAEVERISLAIDLADFPIPQGKITTTLGLPRGPCQGGSMMPNGAPYMIWALSDPKAERGYYALRVVYRLYRKDEVLPKPEDLEITSVEVLYVERKGLQFVVDPQSSIKRWIPDLRKLMHKANQSPAEFSKRWYDQKGEDEAFLKEEAEPNQPPLQTPVTGTPATGAPVAPPPGAAGR